MERTVTKRTVQLLSFEIDSKTTIHTALLYSSHDKSMLKLPELGAKVKIPQPFYRFFDTVVLQPSNPFFHLNEKHLESIEDSTATKLLNIIEGFKLIDLDLFLIDKNYKLLIENNYGKSFYKATPEDLIISVVKSVASNCEDKVHVLPKFKLRLFASLKLISNTQSDYKLFNYWTYGVHRNWGENDYLIGYLFIHDKNGVPYLTDGERELPCKIIYHKNSSIISQKMKYVNKYVLLKDYNIFTEIYNCRKFYTFGYLVFDLNDALILDLSCESVKDDNILLLEGTSSLNFTHSFLIKLVSKSVPLVNEKRAIGLWLEVVLLEKSVSNNQFLYLNESYVSIFPLLEEGSTYTIYHKVPLKPIYDKKLKVISGGSYHSELPNNSIFHLVSSQADHDSFMDTDSAMSSLNGANYLITFQGKIVQKKFMDPLPSNDVKYAQTRAFDTPGHQTHVIDFTTSQGSKTVSVFLNNWDNMALPYGLIPGMVVVVRNVTPQKGTYYKSTILTSIEIINYEPDLEFETADLYDPSYWGRSFPIGHCLALPIEVVLWNRVSIPVILRARIFHFCTGCGIEWKNVQTSEYCTRCGGASKTLGCKISFFARDEVNDCKIEAENEIGLLFLRKILGASKKVFQKWARAFDRTDYYNYWFKSAVSHTDHSEDVRFFKNTLNTFFMSIREVGGLILDIKCRNTAKVDAMGNAMFDLIDVRLP